MDKKENDKIDYEQFYFSEGVKLANMTFSDVKKGIRYLLTCFEMELKRGVIRDDTLEQIAVACSNAFNFELSNVFFYILLNYVYKPSYLVHIAQNCILTDNAEYGVKILKKVLKDTTISSYTLDYAKKTFDKLKTFSDEFYKKYDNSSDIDEKMSEKISLARAFMSYADFDKAIETYKGLNACNNEQVRSELTLAYFFAGKYDKAEQVIEQYGRNSLRDLSNQLLISFAKHDKIVYNKTKDKIMHLDIQDERERFNIGLSFAQTDEPKLAVSFMEDYIMQGVDDIQVNFYFALACINAKMYDKAKLQLLSLHDFDYFNRYLYQYYLTLCDEKSNERVEYIFNLPIKQFIKINDQIEELLKLDDKKLTQYFHENFYFFLYLCKLQEVEKVNLLLYKIAHIDSAYASFFFNFIYVSDCVPYEVKKNLILLRVSINKRNFKGITISEPVIEEKDDYSKIFDNNFDDLDANADKIINFETAKEQLMGKTTTKKPNRKPIKTKEKVLQANETKNQKDCEKSKQNLESIAFMNNGEYFRFYLPNLEKLSKSNPLLYDATLFAFSYIIDEVKIAGEYDIASIVLPLVKVLNDDKIEKFAISTYIVWKVFHDKKRSLSKITKHFNLSQQDFYDFLNKFNLDLD